MPVQMWKHTCGCFVGDEVWDCYSGCAECETPGEYDGWHYAMHEAMARHQNLWRLKSRGPHRKLLAELTEEVTFEKCPACPGGLIDTDGGEGHAPCPECGGDSVLYDKDKVAEIRRQVLEAFPDAAAPMVPLDGLLALNLATNEIEDLLAVEDSES